MNQKTMLAANAVLILIAAIVGVFLYPALPAQMASHWNAAGVADGTMPKLLGVALFPLIMTLVLVLSVLLPAIDPMKENVQAFRRSYQNFFLWLSVFFFYLFVLTLGWNLGWRFSFTMALIPALAVLWFIIGILLARSKRNWFVGIRTPWTMESEEVWDKTHRLGSLLFQISAAITLIGIFLPALSIYFLVGPIIVSALACVVYSYIVFRQEKALQ